MTILSPLGASGPAALPSATGRGAAPASAAPLSVSATSVTLGQPAAANGQTYSASGMLQPVANPPVWEYKSNDAVSSLMAGNFSVPSLAQHFHGLGAALLERLGSGDGNDDNFSQSVMQLPQGAPQSASFAGVAQLQLHAQLDNQITLNVKTAGGTLVNLTLSNQDDGFGVQVKVSQGKLTDVEREALAKLSDAFQSAIDGMTDNPPHLDLAGLTQFDPMVLASVDLHASVKPDGSDSQTLDFHADAGQRTVNANGPAGAIKLSVDTSHPELWGDAAQRARAVSSYLQQFDSAQQRGKGDAGLMSMFKDAFSEMNNAAIASQPATALPVRIAPDKNDRQLLTGLGDFNASVLQISKSSNPMRKSEVDGFSYQASQISSITGKSQQNRAITQQQQAHLSASYHESLISDLPLVLTTDRQSQNYYYKQIKDDASSTTSIAYDMGVLTKASLNRTASQTTHVMKYVTGDLVQDTTTPSQASQSKDILALLKSTGLSDTSATSLAAYRAQQALSAIGSQVLLESDPARLRGASSAGLDFTSASEQ